MKIKNDSSNSLASIERKVTGEEEEFIRMKRVSLRKRETERGEKGRRKIKK